MILLLSIDCLTSCSIEIVSFENIVNATNKISATGNIMPIIIAKSNEMFRYTFPVLEETFSLEFFSESNAF